MSAEQQQLVKQLLGQLEKIPLSDPGKVLSCAERILAIAPSQPHALHCKGLAQLSAGKIEPGKASLLKAKEAYSGGGAPAQDLSFHIACACYRLGQYKEALDILRSIPEADRTLGCRHLLAQCFYNTEEYAECCAIYEAILEEGELRDEQDKQEIIVNLTAAYAGLDATKVDRWVQEADSKTCDLLYNAATAKIEQKDYDAALALLQRAEVAAREEHELPPQASEADFNNKGFLNDVSSIMVQRAYVHFVKGDESKAEELLKVVLDKKPSSVSTYAVACVNWAAIKRNTEFFDTYRRLKHAETPQVQVKLTSKQRFFVLYNTALLLLHTGKLPQCKATVEKMLKENPESPLGPLAMTALLLKEKSAAKAEAYLKNFLAEQMGKASSKGGVAGGEGSSYAQLLVAQLWLEQGNLAAALKHLAEIQSLTESNPAAIATLARGHVQLGDVEAARSLLKKAIAAKKIDRVDQFAAEFFLRHGLFQDAAETYEALLKTRKDDPVLLAGYAASLAASDPAEAYTIASSKLLSAADLQAADPSRNPDLEKQPLPRNLLEEKGYKRLTEGAGPEGQVKEKARRRRPMRRPPAATTTGAPDPERWVPMSMRPSVKALPPRRVREMKKIRAAEQEQKRKAHMKKQQQQQGEGEPKSPKAAPAASAQ